MKRRPGFTLIEVMISVTLLLVVMGAAVQFMRGQSNAVTNEARRMDALQNVQFAATQIERELREAGVGVTNAQPMIVQLDGEAITFNANLVSRDPTDVRAVYRVPDADAAGVRSMLRIEARPLPNSNPAVFYPDSTYLESQGVESGAETISYYLTKDASATTANTWSLWRRVNTLPPALVARDIVKNASDSIPFFTYFRQDTLGNLIPVPAASYPLYHTAVHGSALDIGKSALTDSIRVVRLRFTTVTVDRRAKKDSLKYRVIESRVRLMNAGLLQRNSCGDRPPVLYAPSVAVVSPTPATRAVKISWSRSAHDGAGENDIERYAVFRRLASGTSNGEPITSVIATRAMSYSFTDTSVQPGESYVYGIAAQDCTPSVSDVALAYQITVNP